MGRQSFELFSKTRQRGSLEPILKMPQAGHGVQAAEERSTKNSKEIQGFWEFRPFSRIVNWGRDFKNCVQYLTQNVLEATGFTPFRPRKNYYLKWIKDPLHFSNGNNY